jgi:hypothetical protein
MLVRRVAFVDRSTRIATHASCMCHVLFRSAPERIATHRQALWLVAVAFSIRVEARSNATACGLWP